MDDIDPATIWDYKGVNTLFSSSNDSLAFSIFYLNPYASKEEIDQKMLVFFKQLEQEFEPYTKHYPWFDGPPEIELIRESKRVDFSYIYGEVPFGDYINDEWLIVSLLFAFSSSDPDLYIHVHDNDGEFIITEFAGEHAKHIPDWLTPQTDGNRIWINNSLVKIIPNVYYKDESLSLIQAIKFLEKSNYNCIIPTLITEIIKEGRIANAIQTCLQNLYVDSVIVDSTTSEYITRSKIHVPNSALNILRQDISLFDKVDDSGDAEENDDDEQVDLNNSVELKIPLSVYAHAHLILVSMDLTRDEAKIAKGKFVAKAINYYRSQGHPDQKFDSTKQEDKKVNAEKYNTTIESDPLQTELLKLRRIKQRYESNKVTDEVMDYVKDSSNEDQSNDIDEAEQDANKEDEELPYKDVLKKIENFILQESDIDGINPNKKSDNNTKFEYDSDMYNDDSDYSSDEENIKLKQYFKDQNVDINEDDFFEFFCKEALKMKDEDLENLRNADYGASREDIEDEEEKNQDIEEFSDEENLFNQEDEEETKRSLMNLLESLKEGGGMEGPASALLKNLDFDS